MRRKKPLPVTEELPVPAGIIPFFLLKRKKKTARSNNEAVTQKKIH
ncbi:MAG: hypothetical protein M0Z65_06675 [Firmicutes bacterium]|uniref:Uncharacterized protein n=1 Tax=Melghirimyces thermohalophilus TaxID=1236220 RepID=A0A1G6KR22_9BACL|nr:hypothetical protein [Melghirimyces thermohalophilus]MDA8352864.1 hypothetical protein [Bacillota bacterium]SDC33500.1 hypothetical protein SAMN04488112_106117 [Melghirimyces thermohalophilus]